MQKIITGMVFTFLLAAASSVSAATLVLNGTVSSRGGDGIVDDISFNTEETLFLSETLTAESNSGFNTGSAISNSLASIDAQTGQMRFSLKGQREAVAGNCAVTGCLAAFGASSLTRIIESITLSGTGTLTMSMQVDAFWSAPRYAFSAFTSAFGSANTIDIGNSNININSINSNATSVFRLLTTTITYDSVAESDFILTWGIQGLMNSADSTNLSESGFLDASNTATIFFEATDGLNVSGVTDGFLSNPAFLDATNVTPVPLPGSLPLMLAALSGIFFFRRNLNSTLVCPGVVSSS
jgi:hypothetical protein